MKKMSLAKYLENVGTQAELAKAVGVLQCAVSQWKRSGRNIEVTIYKNGRIEVNEIRPLPARPRRNAA